MSCPDWRALAAHRSDLDGIEPAEWQEALAHLESCRVCWSEALVADPSLLFRRLPEPMAEDIEDIWDVEIVSVQNAVAAMRTASRLEKAPRRGVLGRSWKEWAAAAALVVAVGFGSWFQLGRPQEEGGVEVSLAPAPRSLPLAVPAAGRIEALDRSYNQVKQLGGTSSDDLSITMFYDPSLDV